MEYEQLPEPLPRNPLPLLFDWLEDARQSGLYPNPDAMALATINTAGMPTARIVLCKQIVSDPGYAVFYTNYASAKGEAITANAAVSAVFHWDSGNRQARIEGLAVESPAAESDRYFASRDRESQLGAWASAQSQPIEQRAQLERAMQAMRQKFADDREIPRPPHWGGYRIWLTGVELWLRGEDRLHDRGRWERSLGKALPDGGFRPSTWQGTRLQP